MKAENPIGFGIMEVIDDIGKGNLGRAGGLKARWRQFKRKWEERSLIA